MIVFNWADTGTGTKRLRFESYDDDPLDAPKLNITHTEPGSGNLTQVIYRQPLHSGMRSGMRA